MRTLRGTVRKLGLEGGVWALVTDDGTTIELVDPPAGLCKEGARAQVEVERNSTDVTIGMLGDAARVRKFKLE
jgi:hypothetical protein